MKLEVKGRYVLIFSLVFVIVLGVGLVIAYNDPPGTDTSATFGHSVDEIRWSQLFGNGGAGAGGCASGYYMQNILNGGLVTCVLDQTGGAGGDGRGIVSIDGVSNENGNVDLVQGAGITITPDDANNQITFTATGGGGCGADQVPVGGICRTIPDCDLDTQTLNYDQSSDTFSCGDDDSSGGAGDDLGNHIATESLKMSGFPIDLRGTDANRIYSPSPGGGITFVAMSSNVGGFESGGLTMAAGKWVTATDITASSKIKTGSPASVCNGGDICSTINVVADNDIKAGGDISGSKVTATTIGGFVNNNMGTGSGTNVVISLATGTLLKQSSSSRYKENIKSFSDGFFKILNVAPKKFNYKNTGQEEIGYIAEDFDKMGLNDLVIYDGEGRPDGIKYDKISLYLVEVVKEQQSQIEQQQKTLDEQSKSIWNQQNEIIKLKKAICGINPKAEVCD